MPNTPSQLSPERLRVIALVAVFIVALGLRLIGIGWGLPNDQRNDSYHPDEPLISRASLQIEPLRYPWTPHFYNYPTLYLLVVRVTSDMTAAYSGGYDPNDPKTVYRFFGRAELAGRIISALAGAGTAVVVLLILRRFASELGAVLGAALIAFSPGHVVHSRFQTVDIFAAFLLAVSALFALRILTRKREGGDARSILREAVLSGVFAGLSAGTKYVGILGLLTLFAVLLMHRSPGRWKAAAAGVAAAFVTFLVVTPGLLWDTEKFLKDTMYEARLTQVGHGHVFEATTNGFVFHLSNLFLGIGWILTVLSIIGVVTALVKRHAWMVALVAFAAPYYILIGQAQDKYLRYSFPLYIVLAVGFGWLMSLAHARKRWGHLLVGLGLAGLGGLFDPGGLRSAVNFTDRMAKPDVRDAVGQHFHTLALPADIVVGLAQDPWFWSPALYPEVAQLRRPNYADIDLPMRSAQHPRVERYVPTGPDGHYAYDGRIQWDTRLITEKKPEYVVFSSFELAEIARLRALSSSQRTPDQEQRVQQEAAFAEALKARYRLYSIEGSNMDLVEDMMYVAPTLFVWKRLDIP